jgi:hypothetical protein
MTREKYFVLSAMKFVNPMSFKCIKKILQGGGENMTLKEVAREVNEHLYQISKFFKPEMKITFIARLPGNDNADFVLTIDDLDEAIKALQRRREK